MICKNLNSLIEKINKEIEVHINRIYFQYTTREKAIESLINRYEFIIKEIYCNSCSKNSTCKYYLKEQEYK